MKYFFSGGRPLSGEYLEQAVRSCPWRLVSCHPLYIKYAHDWATMACEWVPGQVEMMLDSGAFTAWSKGQQVRLDDLIRVYDDFRQRYAHGLSGISYINLDVIPGSKGVTASPSEIANAYVESDRNFEILQKQFGIVLPVFHQNESIDRLREIAKQSDYIGVSPRNDLHEKTRIDWALQCHRELGSHIHTHGLATTGMEMLTRVPWYSADSATWLMAGAYGGILTYLNGRLMTIKVSDKSPTKSDLDAHFDTMVDGARDAVVSRVEARGFTIHQMRTDHRVRMVFNLLETVQFVQELQPRMPESTGGLFDL